MKIDNAVALVTGANRGIGLAFTRELLARGARKVYAGARDPATVVQPGVEALRLDVTRPDEVAAAAATMRSWVSSLRLLGVRAMGSMQYDGDHIPRIADRQINRGGIQSRFPIPFCLRTNAQRLRRHRRSAEHGTLIH